MFYYFYNYNFFNTSIIFILFLISFGLTLLLFFISYFNIKKHIDVEKLSIYECGFQPFDYNENTFDIKYYLIAVLFIIFDLELIFLLPWVLTISYLSVLSLINILYFIFILTFGFIYEWYKGALIWN